MQALGLILVAVGVGNSTAETRYYNQPSKLTARRELINVYHAGSLAGTLSARLRQYWFKGLLRLSCQAVAVQTLCLGSMSVAWQLRRFPAN